MSKVLIVVGRGMEPGTSNVILQSTEGTEIARIKDVPDVHRTVTLTVKELRDRGLVPEITESAYQALFA